MIDIMHMIRFTMDIVAQCGRLHNTQVVGWLVVFSYCLSRVGYWSLGNFVPSVVVALNGNTTGV